MAYFGEAYMGRRRQQWLRSLAYVEAQTNGTWHRGTINQKKIEGENVVVMATFPTPGLYRLHDQRLPSDRHLRGAGSIPAENYQQSGRTGNHDQDHDPDL